MSEKKSRKRLTEAENLIKHSNTSYNTPISKRTRRQINYNDDEEYDSNTENTVDLVKTAEIMTTYDIYDLSKDKMKFTNYLQELGLLENEKICNFCSSEMVLAIYSCNKDGITWRCYKCPSKPRV